MISLATRRFFRAEFPARTDRAFAVRRMLTAFLKYWQLDHAVESAVLATNELFANAVEHGSSGPADTVTVTVGVEPAGDELRIEVADGSPVRPVFRTAAETEESGRGWPSSTAWRTTGAPNRRTGTARARRCGSRWRSGGRVRAR
ncbi:ATP-binding protein [Streptomyces sp. FXJ1.4098]|nr:ATP-binding protein [Streptomyces sp. FXJ1.4098]